MTDAIQKAREALEAAKFAFETYAKSLRSQYATRHEVAAELDENAAVIGIVLAALDAETEVKVRELAWEGDDGLHLRAKTAIGDYSVLLIENNGLSSWRGPMDRYENVETFEAAKAAAQADFERRIRSALAALDSPAEGEVKVRDGTSAVEAANIGDAVLAWMVKFNLLDADNEYYASDVLAVLDDLTTGPLVPPEARS